MSQCSHSRYPCHRLLTSGSTCRLAGIEKCYQEILEKKQCVSLKELKVNGQDLIAAGIEKGPKIGQTLQTLLQEVIEEPEKNTREYLLARIKEPE